MPGMVATGAEAAGSRAEAAGIGAEAAGLDAACAAHVDAASAAQAATQPLRRQEDFRFDGKRLAPWRIGRGSTGPACVRTTRSASGDLALDRVARARDDGIEGGAAGG